MRVAISGAGGLYRRLRGLQGHGRHAGGGRSTAGRAAGLEVGGVLSGPRHHHLLLSEAFKSL